jgi:hypothetical protein
MKIYCSSCDEVQFVLIDDCRDAKTNKPFQDIVCAECRLVIASGTQIKREWQGLTDDEIYDSYSEPCSDSEMVAFAREIEAMLKEKNG